MLLVLHVLAATGLVGFAFGFWMLIIATRPERPILAGRAAGLVAQPLGMAIGLFAGLTLLFGIVLAIDLDEYQLWDGWVLASIALWVVGSVAGQRGGVALGRAGLGGERAAADRRLGTLLHAVGTISILIVLYLMIAKPGA